ncbi:MAG TPA: dTDP-4-dehydrorhamnose 3,5-epimerase [Bacteroidia bacterium]|nr:dTDP-4-dehydrorhamnose 3,5-epimerase [Bacteroidia bacterium]HNT81077.1 dTDP-4-dehydrorhamnose 3,5-epimerase [Bacteroidia bacterium]
MKVEETSLPGVFLITPKIFEDLRGHFFEAWNQQRFAQNNLDVEFVQDNQSLSKKGVIRGLHFQRPPYAQGKLVRVLRGSIIDVAVDIRKGSKNYGKHFAIELNTVNNNMLFIPAGFAHGFSVQEDQTAVLYKCTAPYHAEAEMGIRFNDKDLNINWKVDQPIVSEKDLDLPLLKEFDSPFI